MVEVRRDYKSNTWIVTTVDSEGFHRQMNLSEEDLNWLVVDWMGIRRDEIRNVGLGELLLFGDSIETFIESGERRNRVLRAVLKVCGYDTPAWEFVEKIGYDEFRKTKGIGEVSALGLRMFLLHICGIDWLHLHDEIQ